MFQAANSPSGLRQKEQALSYVQAEENCSHFISICELDTVPQFSNIFLQFYEFLLENSKKHR